MEAPLSEESGWYSGSALSDLAGAHFQLALIDGPPGTGNRFGVLLNLALLENVEMILVDDTDRPSERTLAKLLSMMLDRELSDLGHFFVISKRQ